MPAPDPSAEATEPRRPQPGLLAVCLRPDILARCARIALVVGAAQILINHGDAIVRGDVDLTRAIKMVLTCSVPFGVSMFASVRTLLEQRRLEPVAAAEPSPADVLPGTTAGAVARAVAAGSHPPFAERSERDTPTDVITNTMAAADVAAGRKRAPEPFMSSGRGPGPGPAAEAA